jgi:hypothetical protein
MSQQILHFFYKLAWKATVLPNVLGSTTHYFNKIKKLVSLLPISLKHFLSLSLSLSLSLARLSFISSSLFKHQASVLDFFILFKHPALWYWCFPASLQPVMVFSCEFGPVLIFSSKFSITVGVFWCSTNIGALKQVFYRCWFFRRVFN